MPRNRKRIKHSSSGSSDDENDDGERQGDASTSSVTLGQFKRLRTGGSVNRSQRRYQDDYENGDEVEEQSQSSSVVVAENDEDESVVEEDELDEETMEEIQQNIQGSLLGAGGHGENGVIEKISLTNFMCHDRMEVSLGPKLNFIIGHNGSGKSAILTGLTIALGGKAAATSRGNSLKSFVKEGKQSAMVEVTLRNTGEEAFRPSQYKNKIVIERTIRADGSGSWKIKNEDHRLISTKREELNAICDHANIQVDNPMSILTQDAARQFLSASHSDEKYQFYLRGTQLAQLRAEYKIIEFNSNRLRSSIAREEQGLPLLREKAREANSLLEVIQKAADQKRLVASLRERLVWASVEEQEAELEGLVERSERLRLKRVKIEDMLAKSAKDEQMHEVTITELEKKSSETVEREAPLLAQFKELRERERTAHTAYKNDVEELGVLNDQYKRIKLQIEGFESRIEVETRKLADGNQEKRDNLMRRKKQATLERKKLEEEEGDQRDQQSDLEKAMTELDREIGIKVGNRDRLRNEVTNSESLMAKLRVTRSNRMTAFGANIPQLIQQIDREKGWRHKPIGPIGAHVKLRDATWAPVLESVLGNTLNAFCVTNHHDRQLLQKIKRQARCDEVTILTGSDEAFDYSSGEPESDVLTILRVLDIESGFLTRQLINSVHIEQSALVRARVEGDNLMRQKRRNIKFCFSMDMYRLGGGNIGSSTMSLTMHRGPPRLSMDIESHMQALEEKLNKDQEEMRAVDHQLESLQAKKHEIIEERRLIRQRIPVLQRQARERHAEEERIDEELREDEPTNIQALMQARDEISLEAEKIKEKIPEIGERRDKHEDEKKKITADKDAIRKNLDMMREQSSTLKPRLDEAATKRLTAHSAGMHYEKELRMLESKEVDLQTSVSTCEKILEQRTVAAEGHCPRVPADGKVKDLDKQIETIEQQLQVASKRHGAGVEAITMQVKQYAEQFQKANVAIRALKELLKDLDQSHKVRTVKWNVFRHSTAVRAKGLFSRYLSQRGYSGSLVFDHNRERLSLTVKTDEATGGHQDKDPKSLSGGEKSFATICLLLALWDSVSCPIRCLDEFDVFMDAVNRRISSAMMVDAAEGPSGYGVQYILITPQSMDNIKLSSGVRIHRLNDPERNQTTLNLV